MPTAGHKDRPLQPDAFMPPVGRSISEAELDSTWMPDGRFHGYTCTRHDRPVTFRTWERFVAHRQACRGGSTGRKGAWIA